jgi:hypothetical protein
MTWWWWFFLLFFFFYLFFFFTLYSPWNEMKCWTERYRAFPQTQSALTLFVNVTHWVDTACRISCNKFSQSAERVLNVSTKILQPGPSTHDMNHGAGNTHVQTHDYTGLYLCARRHQWHRQYSACCECPSDDAGHWRLWKVRCESL